MLHNDPNLCTLCQVKYPDQLIRSSRCQYLAPNHHLPDTAVVGVVSKSLVKHDLPILKGNGVSFLFPLFFFSILAFQLPLI